MAMKSMMFKRPVKLGAKIYHPAPRPQEVDESLLKGAFVEALMKTGDMSVVETPKGAAPAPSAPVAGKAGK